MRRAGGYGGACCQLPQLSLHFPAAKCIALRRLRTAHLFCLHLICTPPHLIDRRIYEAVTDAGSRRVPHLELARRNIRVLPQRRAPIEAEARLASWRAARARAASLHLSKVLGSCVLVEQRVVIGKSLVCQTA